MTLPEWLAQHVPADATGQCAEITQALVEAFPEFRRVRGHVFDPVVGQRYPHWWCEKDGVVLDPTKHQFPATAYGVALHYEEHVGPEPTGKCPNCGGYCYDGKPLCSDTCEREYQAYLMGGL